ncbi:50S ribosomal protein L21 [Pelagibius litoralis]|uniref:Large ribosomal subunit protein bL21 n=1 Tax=Pelagibius litoralis TaxID=374515 RepID=A0A967C491_9PROT|nr:50S ribosomal protein L21 [Pelagibius litoralis]
MFAVIKTGGKQYKVAKDDVIVIEKLEGEAGEAVSFDSVLMVGEGAETKAGVPFVEGASVAAEVVEQTRGDKILIFKKKRRKNHRRTNGHRQDLTVVKITDILTDGKKAAAKAKKAAPKKEAADGDAEAAPKEAKAEKPKAAKKAPAKKAAAKKATAKKAPAKKAAAKKKED